jgi:hypothetical protein
MRALVRGLLLLMALTLGAGLLETAAAGLASLHAQDQVQLTAFEKLRVENINLLDALRKALRDADSCRDTLATQQVSQAVQQLKADVEGAHPGYAWDVATGTFTPKLEDAPR